MVDSVVENVTRFYNVTKISSTSTNIRHPNLTFSRKSPEILYFKSRKWCWRTWWQQRILNNKKNLNKIEMNYKCYWIEIRKMKRSDWLTGEESTKAIEATQAQWRLALLCITIAEAALWSKGADAVLSSHLHFHLHKHLHTNTCTLSPFMNTKEAKLAKDEPTQWKISGSQLEWPILNANQVNLERIPKESPENPEHVPKRGRH